MIIHSIAILLLVFTIFISSAKAEEMAQPPINPPHKILPSKIKPVRDGEDIAKAAPETKIKSNQTLNQLSVGENYGDGAKFWEGTNIEDIIIFLKKPLSPVMGAALRNMVNKAILTLPPTDENSEDLYSLRIAKLVEIGNFPDAIALYKANESSIVPSSLAARAGVEAMLGDGQIAVACLEQKALPIEMQSDNPLFWQHLNILCQSILGPVSEGTNNNDDSRLNNASRIFITATSLKPLTNIEDINLLTTPTIIANLRGGAINQLLKNTNQQLSVINDKTLAILVGAKSNDKDVYFTLLNEAMHRGLINDDKLIKSVTVVEKTDKWDNFVKIYTTKDFIPNGDIIKMAKNLNIPYILSAKSNMFAELSNEEIAKFDSETAKNITILLLFTNHSLVKSWVENAFEYKKDENFVNGEELLTNLLLSEDNINNQRKAQLLAFSAVLSNDLSDNKIKKSIYDNVFSLTSSDNYVMHMDKNLSSLQKSVDKKLIGRVVIDSIDILSSGTVEEIRPFTLLKVFEALDSVGLSEETMFLIRENIGNLIIKN